MKCPGEDDDKCCWCLPIACGLKFICIVTLLGGLSALGTGSQVLGANVGAGACTIAQGVFMLIAAVHYIAVFKNADDASEKAVKGAFWLLAGLIMQQIALCLITGQFVSGIIGSGIDVIWCLYLSGVAKRL